MNSSHLSHKGFTATQTPARVDMKIYFEAMENLYHPDQNPSGALPMNVAENHLCWEMLRERIQKVTRENDIPDWVASYTDPSGAPTFREATAGFLSKFLFKVPVDAESLAFSSGATSVIEMSAFLLANPGDTAVIPAPSYPVYTGDIGVVPSVKRYDLQTHVEVTELNGGISISTELLEKAKSDIESKGSRFKILILTTPDNPTGAIYSEEQLRKIADWCIQNEVHLVVNEIYSLSRIDISHPELTASYPNPIDFVSFGKLMAEYQSPYLHFWYSFSKDLGISGFRVGLVHSHNQDFLDAYRNAGMGHSISNFTQWVMQEVMADHTFLEAYFTAYRKELTQSYLIVTRALRSMNITFSPSYGSLFVWMDISRFLGEKTEKGEEKLWIDIYENTGVLLTPAHGFGHQKRGLFRMVISGMDHAALQVAMDRLYSYFTDK
ncbi:aminotransferase class I/II-fold pyridoxal phosphate-dependent enzyme [Algoriphagus vanfongensis]|uniref:aminotransferase class I/II-fold pyridoxal phosphate-dependent enzyme n=1 Tax=Algoriphagus vanfongensis TaxID=426371 RepID=UPI00041235A8|nr:aminotransferase class I/II-fold pyridoxal phosphate-dependent enzyme [Algoriphagus vanfongensis]